MPNILILVSEGKSRYLAVLSVAQRLYAAGYTVSLASTAHLPDPQPAYLHGIIRLPDREHDPAGKGRPPGESRGNTLLRTLRNGIAFSARRHNGLRRIHPETYGAVLTEVDPDLILLDVELHAYIVATQESGRPYFLYADWYQTLPLPGLPPVTTGIRPDDPNATERTEMAWRQIHDRRARLDLRARLVGGFNNYRSVLHAYAKKHGFPLHYLRHDGWPAHGNYDGIPTLRLVPRQLEFPHPIPGHEVYVGPAVPPPAAGPPAPTGHAELDAAIATAKDHGQKLVYVTFSTMKRMEAADTDRLIEVFRERPDWCCLLSYGGFDPPVERLAENVHTFRWVPQRELLRHVDACLHFGSGGTIMECAVYGVPQLIVPGTTNDQPGNSARAGYHGIASLVVKGADPAVWRQALNDLLNDQALHNRVSLLAEEINSPTERNRLLEAIEAHLGRVSP